MLSALEWLIPDSRLWLVVLLHFSWQAVIVISLAAVWKSLIRPENSQARYVVQVMALGAVLLAPLVTGICYAANPHWIPELSHVVASSETALLPVISTQPSVTEWFQEATLTIYTWFDMNRYWWLGIWLSGFLLLMTRLGIGFAWSVRLRRNKSPLPPSIQKVADELRERLNVSRSVIVASSQHITQAVATGVLKPVVLIPSSWITGLPVSAIEAVLAHELAHIKRWDLWVNLLQRIAETLFFFHPLVWWLSRSISTEREICCDRLAINITGEPLKYVETLACVAGTNVDQEVQFQFGTAFNGGKKMHLLRRAKMILEPASIDAGSPVRSMTLALCIGLVATCGSWAWYASPDAPLPVQEQEVEKVKVEKIYKLDTKEDGDTVVWVENVGGDQEAVVDLNLSADLKGILTHAGDHSDPARLAQQLRKIADQLEAAEGKSGSKHLLRRKAGGKDIIGIVNIDPASVDFTEGDHDEQIFVELHTHEQEGPTASNRKRIIRRSQEASDGKNEFRFEVKPDFKWTPDSGKEIHVELRADDKSDSPGTRRHKVIRRSRDGANVEEEIHVELHPDVQLHRHLHEHAAGDEEQEIRLEVRESDQATPKLRQRYELLHRNEARPHREHQSGTGEKRQLIIRHADDEGHVFVEELVPHSSDHRELRFGDGAKARMDVQVKGDNRFFGKDRDVEVDVIRGDLAERPQKVQFRPGNARTSDAELSKVLRELREEVRVLRKEVKEMRARGKGNSKATPASRSGARDNRLKIRNGGEEESVEVEIKVDKQDPVAAFRQFWTGK